MKYLAKIAVFLFLVVLLAPSTHAHDQRPIPTITPYTPDQRSWAARSATQRAGWSSWRATMVAETDAWVDRTQATWQANVAATIVAQPTRTPRAATTPTPAATPMPLYWDVTVLEFESDPDERVRKD